MATLLTAADLPASAFLSAATVPPLSWHYADDGHIRASWPECLFVGDTETWSTRSAVFHGDSGELLRLTGDEPDPETAEELQRDIRRGERGESTRWRRS